jgi:hypothetical protein
MVHPYRAFAMSGTCRTAGALCEEMRSGGEDLGPYNYKYMHLGYVTHTKIFFFQ